MALQNKSMVLQKINSIAKRPMVLQNKSLALQNKKKAMVLHGNPTDPDLLATEGINEMDAFVAVTDDEESNII